MHLIEWLACLTGLIGAFLLASNNRSSKWGFVAFLASNALWIAYGISIQAWGLITMQVGFTATSLIGIAKWFSFTVNFPWKAVRT